MSILIPLFNKIKVNIQPKGTSGRRFCPPLRIQCSIPEMNTILHDSLCGSTVNGRCCYFFFKNFIIIQFISNQYLFVQNSAYSRSTWRIYNNPLQIFDFEKEQQNNSLPLLLFLRYCFNQNLSQNSKYNSMLAPAYHTSSSPSPASENYWELLSSD